ncbi:hypothetical protein [Diaphorobacter sp. LR2014-1]|uniref:hypothetical protein n=1 Tax=Diaphorobacter sp. LR2014-1 TaxID=1933219 RepID=UPI00155E8471|nr:hypothetical protein [Diaphorobacter sp. LR2014-1]
MQALKDFVCEFLTQDTSNAQRDALARTMKDDDLTATDLHKRLVAGPEQVDAMLSHFDPSMRGLLSTDNNLYLEYATPKGNALRYDTVPAILNLLTAEYAKR